jgi:hypothetical protein
VCSTYLLGITIRIILNITTRRLSVVLAITVDATVSVANITVALALTPRRQPMTHAKNADGFPT